MKNQFKKIILIMGCFLLFISGVFQWSLTKSQNISKELYTNISTYTMKCDQDNADKKEGEEFRKEDRKSGDKQGKEKDHDKGNKDSNRRELNN